MHPSQGKRGSSVKNWGVFVRFFLVGCTPLRENDGRVSKTGGFLRFWGSRNCPENCAHDSFYDRFFERRKMSENRQKTSKTGGFWRFFRVRSNPLGIRLSSVKNWIFFAILVCPNLCSRFVLPHTALSRLCPEVKRGGFRLV